MLNTLTVKPVRVDGGGGLVWFCVFWTLFLWEGTYLLVDRACFLFVCVFVKKWKRNAWSEEKGVKRNLQHVGGGR